MTAESRKSKVESRKSKGARRWFAAMCAAMCLTGGCWIQVREVEPPRLTWEDPAIIGVIGEAIGDILERLPR